MIAIEYLRGGNAITAGFGLDKWTIKEILYGIISGFLPICFALFLLIILGYASVQYGKGISLETVFVIFSLVFLEELIFRGTIFQALIERFNAFYIIMIVSLLFACLHLANPHADALSTFNTFLANCLMSIAWYHTKGLWLPITYHAVWNLSQSILGLQLSGMNIEHGLIQVELYEQLGSSFIIGPYGIEGTLYCTIALIVLLVLTLMIKNSPYRQAAYFKIKYPKIQS